MHLPIPLRPTTHVYPLPWHRQPIAIVSHEPTITLVSLNVEAVFTLGTRLARASVWRLIGRFPFTWADLSSRP